MLLCEEVLSYKDHPSLPLLYRSIFSQCSLPWFEDQLWSSRVLLKHPRRVKLLKSNYIHKWNDLSSELEQKPI